MGYTIKCPVERRMLAQEQNRFAASPQPLRLFKKHGGAVQLDLCICSRTNQKQQGGCWITFLPPLHLFKKPTKEVSRFIPRRVVSQSLLRHGPCVLCCVACTLHPGYSNHSTGTANPTHVRKSQTRSGAGGPDGDASAALSLSFSQQHPGSLLRAEGN